MIPAHGSFYENKINEYIWKFIALPGSNWRLLNVSWVLICEEEEDMETY